MNYLQEINLLYDWIELHSMSKSAISLWYALMHMNNKAKWSERFSVSLSTLETKTGFKKSDLYRARAELTDLGMIEWHERNGNLCAIYKMISLCDRPLPLRHQDPNTDPEQQPDSADKNLKPKDITGTAETDSCEPNSEPNGEPNGEYSASKVDSINKGKEMKLNFEEPKGSLSSDDDAMLNSTDIAKAFNQICKNLPPANTLNSSRRRYINARLREHGSKKVMQVLRLAAKSDFLAGQNNNQWVATIDWLFKPTNFVKVLDGNYNNQNIPKPRLGGTFSKPSPFEILKDCFKTITGDDESDN